MAIERAREALASGGRSTSQGLLAAQLEVQKQTLAHQREVADTQLREQRLVKFGDVYGRFLEEAKAYARAIDDYWKAMYVSRYAADRTTRIGMQLHARAAKDAMERALQPILLLDSDKTRGELRWEILRRRGLEPTIDNVENQRRYAEVIHYKHLTLLNGITKLQDNVQVALGHPPREESVASKEFIAKMFAETKVKADAIEADIKQQDETHDEGRVRAGISLQVMPEVPAAHPDRLRRVVAEDLVRRRSRRRRDTRYGERSSSRAKMLPRGGVGRRRRQAPRTCRIEASFDAATLSAQSRQPAFRISSGLSG